MIVDCTGKPISTLKIKLRNGWKEIESPLPEQRAFSYFTGLKVLYGTTDFFGDNWLHVSCSHKNKIPSWKDLCMVKDIFIGDNKKAIQIFPTKKNYVNFHPYTLHLWCNLTRDIIPDFNKITGIV